MSDPKRHHYIAQMHLAHFTDASGRLYFHDKRAGPDVRPAFPDAVFFKKHLYSFTKSDGTHDARLEKDFARIEGAVSALFTRVIPAVRAGAAPQLNAVETEGLQQYFYYQWKRVPEFHAKITSLSSFDAMLPAFIREVEQARGKRLTSEERDQVTSEAGRKQMFELARARAIADPGIQVLDVISKAGLKFGAIASPAELIIGSQPIVVVRYPGVTAYEIWLPLAYDVGLVLTQLRGPNALFVVTDQDTVDRINAATFAQSFLVAGRNPSMVEALVRSAPATPPPIP